MNLVGVQFHGLWDFYTPPQRRAVLDMLHKVGGVSSVRLDISWARLQPHGPANYEPAAVHQVDELISMCQKAGIRPLVLLRLAPAWARPSGSGENAYPLDPADFGRIAGYCAHRWGGRVVGWEIWNEQNVEDFAPGGTPVQYVDLLRAAYQEIKAAWPSSTVVFGGLQYNAEGWLAQAYEAGARPWFDVMAVHPYMGPSDLSPISWDNGDIWRLDHLRAVRDEMIRASDGDTPVWITEFGWSTHGNDHDTPSYALGVTEDLQATYLRQAVDLVRSTYPYVQRMYWYNEIDLPWGGLQVQHYGLIRADMTPKPALHALGQANGVRPQVSPPAAPAPAPAPAHSQR